MKELFASEMLRIPRYLIARLHTAGHSNCWGLWFDASRFKGHVFKGSHTTLQSWQIWTICWRFCPMKSNLSLDLFLTTQWVKIVSGNKVDVNNQCYSESTSMTSFQHLNIKFGNL